MLLEEETAEVPPEDTIVAAKDLYGYVGTSKDGQNAVKAFGMIHEKNDGEWVLGYADSHIIFVMNTKF